jgi:hypothetical protein
MATKKNTAITTQEPSGYNALADTDIGALLSEELDGLKITFGKVKIPAGGVLTFEVPGEDGEPESTKEFSAVILFQHPLNCYYATKYTGGNQPPDCASLDGKTGIRRDNGLTRDCANCHLNLFGSAENGGKACQNRRRIYLLREGELFPLLLSLPTGSLQEFTRYLVSLLTKGRKSNAVVTRFSLQKATNKGGITYSQVKFAVDRVLTAEEYAQVQRLSEQIRNISLNVGFEEDAPPPDEVLPPDVDPETGEYLGDVEPLA